MKDFEVHPIGTAQEIKLSRELMNVISQEIEQYGEGIFSHQVKVAYNRLYGQYVKHQQNEDL